MTEEELNQLLARVTALETEKEELKAQVDHDNETRQQLLQAAERVIPTIAKQQEQWEARYARGVEALQKAPELERLREAGLMPKFALLLTRQRILEEQFVELRALAIDTYTLVGNLISALGRG
jgi:hypothetical protein